ncbi:MAG: rod shape-determining protein MreC [Planctomycetota bacterium]
MARRSSKPAVPMAGVAVALAVITIVPTRFSGWLGWFRDPVETVLAPISGPVAAIADRLRGEVSRAAVSAERDREALAGELERLQQQHAAALVRNAELEALVQDLQQGVPFRPDALAASLVAVRVGGTPPATIVVNRGARDGVRAGGTVAVARGSQQLVGIVSRASTRASTVRVLTDASFDEASVGAVVVGEEGVTSASIAGMVRLELLPTGDGRLAQDDVPEGDASRIEIGQLVRLDDERWPTAAQMFVLGRVTDVRELADEPLHRQVLVRPLGGDLSRTRSVILHVSVAGFEEGEGDPGGRGGDGS